ncbi:MAG: hypothetical protein QXT66_05320 [Nitrososphaerota archaeon]
MHVFDYLVDVLSRLFRFHSPREKAYAALLFLAGLSLRDVSERYGFTDASRESVREWVHRLRRAFNPIRKPGRLVAVDETVEKRLGERVYLWSAIDVDTGEIIAVYASKGRSILG